MFTEVQRNGARWVLADALETCAGDNVLVFHDEHTSDLAACFHEVAVVDFGARASNCMVSSTQQRLQTESPISFHDIRSHIDCASRLVLLQKRDIEVSSYRLAVLEYASRNPVRRIASMPGITLDSLAYCRGDLRQIEERCDLLCAVITRAKEARIVTTTTSGDSVSLEISLGTYKPIKSTGWIAPGSWGNVPSGETFVVPNPSLAEGTVAVTGSIPDYVIPRGQEAIIMFSAGRVIRVQTLDQRLSNELARFLLKPSGGEVFANSTALCELGIGTNECIPQFTGLPMLDEKILGTAHLGLGRNTQFCGPIASPVHNDLVLRHSSLYVSSVLVLDEGTFVLSHTDAFPNWRSLQVPYQSVDLLYRLGKQVHRLIPTPEGPEAHLVWMSPRDSQICTTRIGDKETSRIAANILSEFQDEGPPRSLQILIKELKHKANPDSLLPTLDLLRQYQLLDSEHQ